MLSGSGKTHTCCKGGIMPVFGIVGVLITLLIVVIIIVVILNLLGRR
jgi:hypothetical protein